MPQVGFLSLSFFQVSFVSQEKNIAAWNRDISDKAHSNHFFVKSPDHQTITVLKEGIYQVQIRITGMNTSRKNPLRSLALQVNGIDLAEFSFITDSYSNQKIALMFEIISLKAMDQLQVRCNGNGDSFASDNSNRFTILYLGT
jgi:hypothetical protein